LEEDLKDIDSKRKNLKRSYGRKLRKKLY